MLINYLVSAPISAEVKCKFIDQGTSLAFRWSDKMILGERSFLTHTAKL